MQHSLKLFRMPFERLNVIKKNNSYFTFQILRYSHQERTDRSVHNMVYFVIPTWVYM